MTACSSSSSSSSLLRFSSSSSSLSLSRVSGSRSLNETVKAPREDSFVPKKGWGSLLNRQVISIKPVSEVIFEKYAQVCSDAIDFLDTEEGIAYFSRVVRNEYMRALILGDLDQAQDVRNLASSLGGLSFKLFKDIHRMLEEGYNPFWQVSLQQYAWEYLTENHGVPNSVDGKIKDLVECSAVYQNPLLAYRMVYHINYVCGRKNGVSSQYWKRSESQYTLLKSLQLSQAHTHFYYYYVLKTNFKLQEIVSDLTRLFFKYPDESPPELTHHDLAKRLVEEAKEAKSSISSSMDDEKKITVLKILKYIRCRVHFSYFSLPQPDSTVPVLSVIGTPKFDDIKTDVIDGDHTIKLPFKYRQVVKQQRLDKALEQYSENPPQYLLEIRRIAQWLHLSAENWECFQKEMIELAMIIRNSIDKLDRGKRVGIVDVWPMLIKGSLTPKQINIVLQDLTVECVRLLRQVSLYDLSPKIAAFYQKQLTYKGADDECRIKLHSSRLELSSSLSLSGSSSSSCSPRTPRTPRDDEFTMGITQFFNQFTQMIGYSILSAKKKKTMSAIVKNCLRLARTALEPSHSNLHVAYVVYSALSMNPVSRIKTLFSGISEEDDLFYQTLERLFSPAMNFSNYRTFLQTSKFPVIPVIPFIQKDFAFAVETDGVTDEQAAIVMQQVNSFLKMQHLLKTVYTTKPHKTDIVKRIHRVDKKCFTAPPKKCEVGESPADWGDGEWDRLEPDEQFYFISRYHW